MLAASSPAAGKVAAKSSTGAALHVHNLNCNRFNCAGYHTPEHAAHLAWMLVNWRELPFDNLVCICDALRNCTEKRDEASGRCRSSARGAIPLLIAMLHEASGMQTHSTPLLLFLVSALKCLQVLVTADDASAKLVSDMGVISETQALLVAYPASRGVQLHGVLLFGDLAHGREGIQRRIWQQGALEATLVAIRRFQDDFLLQAAGCFLMCCVTWLV